MSNFESSQIIHILKIALEDSNRWVRRDAKNIIYRKQLAEELGVQESIGIEDTSEETSIIVGKVYKQENLPPNLKLIRKFNT